MKVLLTQVKGFAGNPFAVPRRATADFLTRIEIDNLNVPDCPDSAASISPAEKKGPPGQ